MNPLKKRSTSATRSVLTVMWFLLLIIHTCERFEPDPLLLVKTDGISGISAISCSATGTIIHLGKGGATEHGFVWSKVQNPTIQVETRVQLGSKSTTGKFSETLSGLSAGTTYNVRAYATDDNGTVYGDEKQFTTLSPSIPTLTTSSISGITETSAQSGGSVTDDGGSTVTARGVCWSTSQNPTISNSKTTDGSDVGSFTSSMTGLSCGTTYYVRAYAINSAGTGYGTQVSFKSGACPLNLPTVTTTAISSITETSARSGGSVTDDGGSTVTARGVCWSISQNPTISNSKTTDGNGTGSFTSSLTGLSSVTTYYVRAYATNSVGTAYGDEMNFKTWYGSVTDYDGNIYPTVLIGSQTWMAENLKTTRYADGSTIPLVEDTSAWNALTTTDKAYSWYDNSTSNRDTYGGLYTWAAAMNGAGSSSSNPSGIQGVCPSGWHLPSDEEWKELEMYLGMSQAEADDIGWRGSDEGGKLKEAGTTHWYDPNIGATNESGFTALPGGLRYDGGSFINLGYYADFWTATEDAASYAWYRGLSYDGADVLRLNYYYKNYGFSVRCVGD